MRCPTSGLPTEVLGEDRGKRPATDGAVQEELVELGTASREAPDKTHLALCSRRTLQTMGTFCLAAASILAIINTWPLMASNYQSASQSN